MRKPGKRIDKYDYKINGKYYTFEARLVSIDLRQVIKVYVDELNIVASDVDINKAKKAALQKAEEATELRWEPLMEVKAMTSSGTTFDSEDTEVTMIARFYQVAKDKNGRRLYRGATLCPNTYKVKQSSNGIIYEGDPPEGEKARHIPATKENIDAWIHFSSRLEKLGGLIEEFIKSDDFEEKLLASRTPLLGPTA